jgi:rhodanese-related sulfurtransferase
MEPGSRASEGERHAPHEEPEGSMSVSAARKLVSQGALLVDVREPFEYERGHIENAMPLPLSQLRPELFQKIPKDKPVIVYCQHGVRSLVAVTYMREIGYSDSHSIAGGIEAWQEFKA